MRRRMQNYTSETVKVVTETDHLQDQFEKTNAGGFHVTELTAERISLFPLFLFSFSP